MQFLDRKVEKSRPISKNLPGLGWKRHLGAKIPANHCAKKTSAKYTSTQDMSTQDTSVKDTSFTDTSAKDSNS